MNISTCPQCGHDHIAVEVITWADFHAGKPSHYDEEDIDIVEIKIGGQAICRNCQHQWTIE